MLFNSIEFILFFLPIVFIGFLIFTSVFKGDWAKYWLILSSLFFYAWWEASYLLIIVFSMLINYGIGVLLSQSVVHKRALMTFAILANLLVLGYYKYSNFFIEQVGLSLGHAIDFEKILLPLAISFFTFQQIAYLVDAFRGEVKSYGFGDYCLFVAFFPQLIAGPIVHHKEVMGQFKSVFLKGVESKGLTLGLLVFIIGLFKKVIFADGISEFSGPIFQKLSVESLSFFEAWSGALGYTLQLYFDFSGYSDMAIGVAMMFGIVLPNNFNSPYKALSIIDFWRRWHITLSNFLRDYVYFSLGGNRKGVTRRYANLFLTMLLGGLWHGAGWGFIFWGFLHGFFLVVNHYWNYLKIKFDIFKTGLPIWLSRFITMICVVVAWVFFKVENFEQAISMISSMWSFEDELYVDVVENMEFTIWILVLFGIVFWVPNTMQILRRLDEWLLRGKFVILAMTAAVVLFYLLINIKSDAEFLYFNF